MGMIGNQLAAGTALTVANDSFNGNGSTTAFTLSQTVSATTDIEVLVDNVQQSPYDSSYSVSGTTLTFSAAPAAGTNNIYVIYNHARTITTNQVVPDDGSVHSSKIANNAVTPAKLHTDVLGPITVDTANNRVGIGTTSPDGALHVKGSSDHGRVIIESGGTSGSDNNMFMQFHNGSGTEIAQIEVAEGASNEGQIVFKTGGTTTNMTITKEGYVKTPNQPSFRAYSSSDYTANGVLESANWTEQHDNNNDFSNGRFTAPVDGVYHFDVYWDSYQSLGGLHLLVNTGSYYVKWEPTGNTNNGWETKSYSTKIKLSSGDYVRLVGAHASGNNPFHMGSGHWGFFAGHLLG